MSGQLTDMNLDDASIMRASMSEPERFGAVFDRYHSVVWRYVARLGGRDLADDISGDVFVIAFARRATFDPELGSVRAWLYGIATNRMRTRLRGELRARRAFYRIGHCLDRSADATALVDNADELSHLMRITVTAIGRLRRDDRELIVLYAWEELSYAEIAAALGLPIGTVRSRLSRTRRRLEELVMANGEQLRTPTLKEGS